MLLFGLKKINKDLLIYYKKISYLETLNLNKTGLKMVLQGDGWGLEAMHELL